MRQRMGENTPHASARVYDNKDPPTNMLYPFVRLRDSIAIQYYPKIRTHKFAKRIYECILFLLFISLSKTSARLEKFVKDKKKYVFEAEFT